MVEIEFDLNRKLVVKSIDRYIVDSNVKEDEELKSVVDELLCKKNLFKTLIGMKIKFYCFSAGR